MCACAKRDFSFGVGSIVTSLWLYFFLCDLSISWNRLGEGTGDAVHVLGRRLGKVFCADFLKKTQKCRIGEVEKSTSMGVVKSC